MVLAERRTERPGQGLPVRGAFCFVISIVLDKLLFQRTIINLTYISQGKTIHKTVLYRDRIWIEVFSTKALYIFLKIL